MPIKPGITPDGFRTAVRDYTEPTVVEELAANSYDADATTVIILLDSEQDILYVIDDGIGFNESSFSSIATLGAGSKREAQFSKGKRHYLGSYGYGLKSTLNICSKVDIESFSTTEHFQATIDWNILDEAFKSDFEGFPSESEKFNNGYHGTQIKLFLKNPTNKAHLDRFGEVLSNLPTDSGGFKCFFGLSDAATKPFPKSPRIFKNMRSFADSLEEKGILHSSHNSLLADLDDCQEFNYIDKDDKSVITKVFFSGLVEDKVRPLKRGLRGIYVRIHGRLLKQSFTESKYTYNISKWKQFESGVRVEISIDWLRDQISLSREGVRFANEKLEQDFKTVLSRGVSSFIHPQLDILKKHKKFLGDKKAKQRNELVAKRARLTKDLIIPGLSEGFVFKPETDGELALVISQPKIQSKLFSKYKLLDYNDSAPFDCIFYDQERMQFINVELEPNLSAFLDHKEKEAIQLVISWTKGTWRIGAMKRANSGYLRLISDPDSEKGHYRLLEFASSTRKKPKKEYPVIIIEDALS